MATPKGFTGSATHAGIKSVAGALDLALIYSEARETTAAGLFTTNRAAAAPVVLSRLHLKASGGRARAVVVNSGNANACTGPAGMQTARETAQAAAKLLGVPDHQVLVASTGLIGVPIKTALITGKLPALASLLQNAADVARAIMTTDAFPKFSVLRTKMGGKTVHLAGVAKGAGMIHPRMATMISLITTDIAIGSRDLQKMLQAAVDASFNRITVDGDTSTNDTVIALASGLSRVQAPAGTPSAAHFLKGLAGLCRTLARMIVKDGEGAKKLIAIEVRGARREADADRIARAIANSPLVKTAIGGGDPNWGRIVCAAGYSGANFDPAKIDIRVNKTFLCRKGVDAGFDTFAVKRQLDQPELTLRLDLHQGEASARILTCDFTHDYITINASSRT